MKKNDRKRKIAKEMTQKEITAALLKIGQHIKAKREEGFSSAEDLAFQINIARANFYRYEAGKDMYLSTFLRIMAGLDVSPGEFFGEVEK